ncbi:hypothetical protein [Spiroplasma floricola]|uniref:Transmembrane protein n=1 Tax=Spiroplasma floricola 23-6 TaxID=1336749 RepID=A0A2K8SEX0_9MOLU|nr:hypothetical protein [Spiroplasma floricola]AUB31972.1 hypothetical protein SFLOR_v1c09240 [Spiroplasma floricola 23-6]
MDWQGYLIIIIVGLTFSLLVPIFIQLSIYSYKIIIQNVISAFNNYSNFKKDFLVLKRELYKFYIQTFVVFVLMTSIYIWAAFLIKPEEKEFLSYIIVISIIYFICLLEILIFAYFLIYKRLKKVKFLNKKEALDGFKELRQEMPKKLSYKSFEIEDTSKIDQVNKHFQRCQKYLKRKIANLKKTEDNYKKIKIFFWYLRANGSLFWFYAKNPLNLQIIVGQNLYEANKISTILIENFFSLLDKQELKLSEI